MPPANIGPTCPFCGRPTSLATIEPHPTLSEIALRTFCCDVCGPVRTVAARGKLRQWDRVNPRGRFFEPSTRPRVAEALLGASRFPQRQGKPQ
jgi:hypothetical protein